MEINKEVVLYITAAMGVVTALLKVAASVEPFAGSKKGKAMIENLGFLAMFLLAIATLILVSLYLPHPFGWDWTGLCIVSGTLLLAYLVGYNLLLEYAEQNRTAPNYSSSVHDSFPKRRWFWLKFARRDWTPKEPAEPTGALVALEKKTDIFLANAATVTVSAGYTFRLANPYTVVSPDGRHHQLPEGQIVSLCTDMQFSLDKGHSVALSSGTKVIVPAGTAVTISEETDADLKAAAAL